MTFTDCKTCCGVDPTAFHFAKRATATDPHVRVSWRTNDCDGSLIASRGDVIQTHQANI